MKKYFTFTFLILSLACVAHAKGKDPEMFTVSQVLDASTIVLDNHQTIHLTGISCPQADSSDERIKKWGEKAKQFTEKMLLNHKVWLEGEKDHETKTWAFVLFVMNLKKMSGVVDEGFMPFWGSSGKFMANRILVENGYCSTSSSFSFKYRSQFMQLEKTARLRQQGMWQDFAP